VLEALEGRHADLSQLICRIKSRRLTNRGAQLVSTALSLLDPRQEVIRKCVHSGDAAERLVVLKIDQQHSRLSDIEHRVFQETLWASAAEVLDVTHALGLANKAEDRCQLVS
jgi:hypothetical protein